VHFGPACDLDLSHFKNTTTDTSTLQTALAASLKDTFSVHLPLFWRMWFWSKEGQNIIARLLYNFARRETACSA
jgi:hypothetical protein